MNQDRWLMLMRSLALAPSLDIYEQLSRAYCETHRFYHTNEHINAMLKHFDHVLPMAEHPAEVELAIWFHDAIYKPLSSTNERDSAEWVKAFLISAGASENVVYRVYDLVMATMHNVELVGNDQHLIVDIDLAILGASETDYDVFERNVRKEYKWVPFFLYKKKRKEVLLSFLDRQRIYTLDYFYNKFEDVARSNLERAIAQL